MTLALTKSPRQTWPVEWRTRTRGRIHGPVTRLMSPSDVGEIPKPYLFLDLIDP